MIDAINAEREETSSRSGPIEFSTSQRCIVNQREVGADAPDFALASGRASQDPDVLLVGEMRDLETISTALTAAERALSSRPHTQSTRDGRPDHRRFPAGSRAGTDAASIACRGHQPADPPTPKGPVASVPASVLIDAAIAT